jgi:F-type H+-transporting ATPase subunit b
MGEFEIFGMPVSLGTMIFQAVIFTALIWILKKKFLGKLVDAMENRRESIDNQLNLAETYKREAEEELLKQREMTEKASQEAKQIIAKAREEANIILKAARKESFTIRTEAYENELRALKGRGAS